MEFKVTARKWDGQEVVIETLINVPAITAREAARNWSFSVRQEARTAILPFVGDLLLSDFDLTIRHPNGSILIETAFGRARMVKGDEYPLECSQYEHWLLARDPDEIVGYAQMGDNCPIQNWLTDDFGDRQWFVNVNDVTYIDHFGYPVTRKLPAWGCRFVAAIDNLPSSVYADHRNAVPAKTANMVRAEACKATAS